VQPPHLWGGVGGWGWVQPPHLWGGAGRRLQLDEDVCRHGVERGVYVEFGLRRRRRRCALVRVPARRWRVLLSDSASLQRTDASAK
jgi:hypothetical protein